MIRIVSGFFANAALLALHERLEPIHALVKPAMLKQTSALFSGKQARVFFTHVTDASTIPRTFECA